jgi:hypothetical protein
MCYVMKKTREKEVREAKHKGSRSYGASGIRQLTPEKNYGGGSWPPPM